jgi:DNA-binding MarR family transcriptional regulator
MRISTVMRRPALLDPAKLVEAGRRCACFNLRKATRAVTSLYDEVLRPTGLRATQFTLLMITKGFGSVSVTRLAEEAVMDRTTLTRNLGPLEKQGLIRVEEGQDRRVRKVTLTPRGHDTLVEAVPLWQVAQTQITKGLGEERLRQLLSNLDATVAVVRTGPGDVRAR